MINVDLNHVIFFLLYLILLRPLLGPSGQLCMSCGGLLPCLLPFLLLNLCCCIHVSHLVTCENLNNEIQSHERKEKTFLLDNQKLYRKT